MKTFKKLICLFPLFCLAGCGGSANSLPDNQSDKGPEITGVKASVEHYTNNSYDLLNNVKATDGKDGDISSLVKYTIVPYCEVNHDTFTPKRSGVYTIFYSVKNSRGAFDKKTCCLNVFDKPSDKTGELFEYKPTGKKARVVILMGQSNTEGFSLISYAQQNLSESEYAALNRGASNVKISNSRDNPDALFEGVRFGFGFSNSRFGPEVGLANKLKYSTEDFYIIKYAIGGTNLAEQWASFSSGKEPGEHFLGAINHISRAISNLVKDNINFEVSAVIWFQGGSDTVDTAWTSHYYQNEVNFTNDIRGLFSCVSPDKGLPWIDVLLSDQNDTIATGNRLLIDEAKIRHMDEDPLGYIVDTRNCGLSKSEEPIGNPDVGHYDALSEIELGRMMGEAVLNVI